MSINYKRHLVQLDGFDANKTKKKQSGQRTLKKALTAANFNDCRNKVMVKN